MRYGILMVLIALAGCAEQELDPQQRAILGSYLLGQQMQQQPVYRPQPYIMPTQRTVNTNCMMIGSLLNCQSQ